jgi:hypothetical protein
MANGAAALSLVHEPTPTFTEAAPPAPDEIEKKIGQAVAAAVGVLAWAVCDFADRGAMTVSTRTWCGTMIGGLTQMRLDMLGDPSIDFDAIAYREGRRAFQGHPSEVFLTHLGPGPVDAVLSELIGHVVAISSKVASDELALRSN